MKKLLVAGLSSVLLVGCSSDNTDIATQSNQETTSVAEVVKAESTTTEVQTKKPKIDYDKIVIPYTQDWTPKLYATWGKEWVDKINKMMPLAVDKVALNPNCDEPDMIELSDNKSVVKKEVVFFVDCKNKQRFYISQNDLD